MFIGEETIKIVDRLGGYDRIKTNDRLLMWAEIITMIFWPLILLQIVIVGAYSFISYTIKFLKKLYKLKKRK
jgi:nitrate reductase NapE component